jgi:anthranilate/para-aminobenzoate synthase component I
LESTLVNTKNRWALLGYTAQSVLKSAHGKTWIDNVEVLGNPFEILTEEMEKTQFPYKSLLPFVGGWVGCVSYEAVRFLENIDVKNSFDFDLAFYKVDSCYVFDLIEKRMFCVSSNGNIPELKAHLKQTTPSQTERLSEDTVQELCRRPLDFARGDGTARGDMSKIQSTFTQHEYEDCIKKIQDYILDGHSYQVNLSQRFTFDNHADPFAIYQTLSQISPVPFAGFFEWEDMSIISGSPERLFEWKDQTITTRPIAGTRRCGSPEEMQRFIQELNNDPKEHAEHCMLVDLERNDLGRLCKYGTVHVKEFMDIVSYKTIIHTESEVQGVLRDDVDFVNIMRALFPGGTITGVPKIRTMEIINENEPCERGIYTGALGYASACGHYDFNIMIRPILCKQGKAYTHAGGGITCKSKAKDEYKETLHKARPQVLAILHTNGIV